MLNSIDLDRDVSRAAPTKGQRSRQRIFDCAMELFQTQGYEKTTMRMIADCAGVNVALSYHYFPSKEHLVFEFYRNFTTDFIARTDEVLSKTTSLEKRLIGVAQAMFQVAAPYHAFAGSLFATAASPTSPLNPFGAGFAEVREEGLALFARVIEGGSPRVPKDMTDDLPFLLWAFYLGLLYCWMQDHSPSHEKTEAILKHSLHLIVGLLRLGSLPGARVFRRQVIGATSVIRSSLLPTAEQAK